MSYTRSAFAKRRNNGNHVTAAKGAGIKALGTLFPPQNFFLTRAQAP